MHCKLLNTFHFSANDACNVLDGKFTTSSIYIGFILRYLIIHESIKIVFFLLSIN